MKVNVKPGRIVMGRLQKGDDLLGALQKICSDQQIRLGDIRALGAVRKARIGYYDQDRRDYSFFDLAQHLELLALVGNVSIRDGKPFLHAHVTFANGSRGNFRGTSGGRDRSFCLRVHHNGILLEHRLRTIPR